MPCFWCGKDEPDSTCIMCKDPERGDVERLRERCLEVWRQRDDFESRARKAEAEAEDLRGRLRRIREGLGIRP